MKSGKTYKAAVVGYGKMGKIRAACAREFPQLKLVGVHDPQYTGTVDGLPAVSDYRKLMDYAPDMVFVCVPNKFVPETVCFFLNQGVHVFCEKPPGRSKEDVDLMRQAQENNKGVKLKFGFNHRYHQAVIDAKAIVDKGRLGKILWMRGIYGKGGGSDYDRNWRNQREVSGGGILIDQGIHMVDLFRLFCGEFEEVKSFIGEQYWQVGVEDNAFMMMRNAHGQVGLLHSSATQWRYMFSLDIYLEKGYVSISGILSSTRNYGAETLKIARCVYDTQGYPLPNPEESINYYDDDHSWRLELEEFVQSIETNTPVKVGSCADAYQTMNLIEQIYAADPRWAARNLPSLERA
jgi:predicted dehydrogenase